MILVVDASVAAKWFLHFRREEQHTRRALEILAGIDNGRVRMLQRPHFIAEMGAVLSREAAGRIGRPRLPPRFGPIKKRGLAAP